MSNAILKTKCRCSCWDALIEQRKPHQEAGPASLRMTGLNTVNLQHIVFVWFPPFDCEACFALVARSGLQTLWRFRITGELTGCLAGNSGSKWCRSIQKSSCLIRQVAGWQWRRRSSKTVSILIIVRGDCKLRPLIRAVAVKSAVYHKFNTFIQCKDGKDW